MAGAVLRYGRLLETDAALSGHVYWLLSCWLHSFGPHSLRGTCVYSTQVTDPMILKFKRGGPVSDVPEKGTLITLAVHDT